MLCVRQVRSATQVGEATLLIKADSSVLQIIEQLYLVRVMAEKLKCFLLGNLTANILIVLLSKEKSRFLLRITLGFSILFRFFVFVVGYYGIYDKVKDHKK
jgi:hypothetical protein